MITEITHSGIYSFDCFCLMNLPYEIDLYQKTMANAHERVHN